jgi:bifunctional UDP-N-acetylglucosamine pyrophosphorylase/glucosamine-1-phosphate N-acetyltransferase
MMRVDAVILAAGLGTRMKSSVPKVLHHLGGKPLIHWSVDACRSATEHNPVVVIGPEGEKIQELLGKDFRFSQQTDRLGTGHALKQTASLLQNKTDIVLVTNADMPLIKRDIVDQ